MALKTLQARRLRRDQTVAETALWKLLRGRNFRDLKFRRQAPIGPYVVDFACLKGKLVLELDGGIHDTPFYDREGQERRDAWLRAEGYRVLRFHNRDVEHAPNAVLERIVAELRRGGTAPSSVGSADTFSPGGEKGA